MSAEDNSRLGQRSVDGVDATLARPGSAELKGLTVRAGPFQFLARLESDLAPATCAYFETLLPYHERLIHVRWSGEGIWVPLGAQTLAFPLENPTSYPAPGQFIFYPGGFSDAEILLAYGGVCFSSKLGQLAGNHFLTIVDGLDQLPELGRTTLWKGAQDLIVDYA